MTVWSQLTLWDDCVGFGFLTYIVFFSFLQMDEPPKTEVSNALQWCCRKFHEFKIDPSGNAGECRGEEGED